MQVAPTSPLTLSTDRPDPAAAGAPRPRSGSDRGRHRPHPGRTPVQQLLAKHRPTPAVETTRAFGELDSAR